MTLGAVHYALLLRLKILNFENDLGKKNFSVKTMLLAAMKKSYSFFV